MDEWTRILRRVDPDNDCENGDADGQCKILNVSKPL